MDKTYENNLATTIASDGGRVEVSADRGIDCVITAEGKAIAVRFPASMTPDSREAHLAMVAIRAATKAAGRIALIDADADHSDEWKTRERAKISDQASAEFAKAKADADAAVASFAAADAIEAAPPALDKTDAVGALGDREVRDWMRGLDASALNALAQEIMDGSNERALLAFARSPLPLPRVLAEVVPGALVDRQTKADPQLARERRDARERVTWLQEITAQAEAALPRHAGTRQQQLDGARDHAIAQRGG